MFLGRSLLEDRGCAGAAWMSTGQWNHSSAIGADKLDWWMGTVLRWFAEVGESTKIWTIDSFIERFELSFGLQRLLRMEFMTGTVGNFSTVETFVVNDTL